MKTDSIPSNVTKTERNPAFELMRVISMSLIIIHHFQVHGIKTSVYEGSLDVIIYPLFLCGLNIFFLISGWFGIRFSIKRLLSLVFIVLFYNLINILLCWAFDHPFTPRDILLNILWPVSRSPYWFLNVYMFLMIFAPVLNAALTVFNDRQLRVVIILLTIGITYSCNLGRNFCDENGRALLHGAYLYFLGYYLRKDQSFFRRIPTVWCIVGWFVLMIFSGFTTYIIHLSLFAEHTSITIIAGSLLLFIAISRVKVKGKLITRLGMVSLGCYLLQDGNFGNEVIYPWIYTLWLKYNETLLPWGVFLGVFIALWLLSLLIHPIIKKFSNQISSCFSDSRFLRPLSNVRY